jgi:hypothetical protein
MMIIIKPIKVYVLLCKNIHLLLLTLQAKYTLLFQAISTNFWIIFLPLFV